MTTMKFKIRIPLVFSICLFVLLLATACKKNSPPAQKVTPYPVTTDSTYSPVDPSPSATIGFFGNGWTGKTFSAPTDTIVTGGSTIDATDSLLIDVNNVLVKAPPLIYGNNSNLWMGQIVTQPALMQYINDLSPNIIRAPAGSISDVYFWNGTAANPTPSDAPAQVYPSGTLGSIGQW